MVDGLSKLPYNERLQRIGIPTLVFRRKRGDLIQMFKHFNVYDRQTLPPSFRPRQRPSRVHNFQLDDHHRYDGARGIRNNFFYQRTRQTWNSLPPSIVNSKSVNEERALKRVENVEHASHRVLTSVEALRRRQRASASVVATEKREIATEKYETTTGKRDIATEKRESATEKREIATEKLKNRDGSVDTCRKRQRV